MSAANPTDGRWRLFRTGSKEKRRGRDCKKVPVVVVGCGRSGHLKEGAEARCRRWEQQRQNMLELWQQWHLSKKNQRRFGPCGSDLVLPSLGCIDIDIDAGASVDPRKLCNEHARTGEGEMATSRRRGASECGSVLLEFRNQCFVWTLETKEWCGLQLGQMQDGHHHEVREERARAHRLQNREGSWTSDLLAHVDVKLVPGPREWLRLLSPKKAPLNRT